MTAGHGRLALGRLKPWLAAAAMALLAGCAVYPDEVADAGYAGSVYYGGGYYDYPGHYYSYYPGYYAYCPPVHIPRHYWSYWRQHRHWPDGWNHGHGWHDHAGNDGHGGHDHDHDHGRPGRDHGNAGAGGDQAQGAADRTSYRGKPNNQQTAQGGYRMPRLANNPAQTRGQFSRAAAAARNESFASRAEGAQGNWRGGDRRRDGGASKAERRGGGAAARSSGGAQSRSDGGGYRGSSGGSGSGYSGGSSGSGYSGGSSGGGWSGGSSGGGSRGGGGRGR